jgi:hypothetical protein
MLEGWAVQRRKETVFSDSYQGNVTYRWRCGTPGCTNKPSLRRENFIRAVVTRTRSNDRVAVLAI